jgi:hypothetical protein
LSSTLVLESHQKLLNYGCGRLRSKLTLRSMELRERLRARLSLIREVSHGLVT